MIFFFIVKWLNCSTMIFSAAERHFKQPLTRRINPASFFTQMEALIFGLTFSADHFSWECSAYLLAKCSSFSGRAMLGKECDISQPVCATHVTAVVYNAAGMLHKSGGYDYSLA